MKNIYSLKYVYLFNKNNNLTNWPVCVYNGRPWWICDLKRE